jgi:hypothetical protein
MTSLHGAFDSEYRPFRQGLIEVSGRIDMEASHTGRQNGAVSPGEAPPITIPVHGLVRYAHTRVEATDGAVRWDVPRTVLGVIPIGVRRIEVPVGDVGSLTVGRAIRPFRLLVGVVLMVAPWFFVPSWAALLMLMFGLWVALVSLGPQLQLVTRSGVHHRAAVCFGHQIDADLYIAAVTDLAGV